MQSFGTPTINMKSEPQIQYRGPPPQNLLQDNCQIEEWSLSLIFSIFYLGSGGSNLFFEFKRLHLLYSKMIIYTCIQGLKAVVYWIGCCLLIHMYISHYLDIGWAHWDSEPDSAEAAQKESRALLQSETLQLPVACLVHSLWDYFDTFAPDFI